MDRILENEVMDSADEAEDYDSMDHAEPNAAFVERLAELGARGRMLDLGTGPGRIPLLVCERIPDCTVLGVDLADSMLAIAEARRKESPFSKRVEFRRADVKELPFEDGSFDAVFSNTLLHHIPEPAELLGEARRVLKPGGVLLIRDLYRPPSPERAGELVALHAADASPRQRELFRASLGAALTCAELRNLADGCGLAAAEIVLDSDRHMSLQIPAPGGEEDRRRG
ncbi:MAG: class I SAM-dependent methyltransferase [Planctomycetota bacterium]